MTFLLSSSSNFEMLLLFLFLFIYSLLIFDSFRHYYVLLFYSPSIKDKRPTNERKNERYFNGSRHFININCLLNTFYFLTRVFFSTFSFFLSFFPNKKLIMKKTQNEFLNSNNLKKYLSLSLDDHKNLKSIFYIV